MESVTPNIPSKTEESKGETLNSNTNEGSRDIIVLLKMRELNQKLLNLMLSQKEGFTEANIEKFYQTQQIHLANQRGNQEDEEHKRDEEGYNYLCQVRQLIASIAALDIKIKLLQELQDEEIYPISEEVEEKLKQWIKEKQYQIQNSQLDVKSRLKVEDRIEELKSLLERFAQVFGQIIQPLDLDLLRQQVYSGLKDFDIAFGKDLDSKLMSLKQQLATTSSPKDKRSISENITSLQNLLGPIQTLITELTNKLQNDLQIQQISLEQLPEMHTSAKQQLQDARGKEKEPAKAHLQKIENLVELQKEIFDLTQPQIPDRKILEQPIPDPPIPEPPISDIEEVKESSILYEIEIQNMKYSKEMPDCFEKCAITICYYLYLIANNKNDELYKLDDINFANQISQESAKLHKFYKQELYNNSLIIEEVDDLVIKTSKGSISESTAKQILTNLSKIILIVRPFCFQDFFDLIKETNDSGRIIDGNNIILMLGSTGCGKSTTIQYLCGSEMELVKTQQGLLHIQARKITNKELERIITKPNAQSVTRFVTPVSISIETITKSVKILLVDTPGTGDRQSTEIDVSNGIGIINAIKPSKSVHPVIILSYLDICSHRGQGLIDQIKYYATMFNNVEENVKSFNYLFSHVPKEIEQIDLLNKIIDIFKCLYPHDKNDQSLNHILEDIISKLQNNLSATLIRPLDLKHSVILNKIYSNQNIKNPIQAFKQNISHKSSDILKTQLSIHDKAIITAVTSENIALALWKLDEFKQMTQIIKLEQFCKSAFDNCIEKIQQILNSNSEREIKKIIRCLSPGNSITKEDINEFKKMFITTKMFEEIREKFLDKNLSKSGEDCIQSVYSSLNQTIINIQTLDIAHGHWFECINKFKYLIEIFPEFRDIEIQLIKNYKLKLITLKEDSIKTLKKIFKKNLKQDQNLNLLQLERKNSIEVLMQEDNSQDGQDLYYNQYSEIYKQLIDAKKQVDKNDEIHTYLEETVTQFEKQLIDQLIQQKKYVTGIIDFKPNPTLTQLNIDVIMAFVNIVNNFITSFSNVSKSVIELISSINESIFKTLQTIFSEKYDDLKTKFKKIIKNTNESGNICNDFEQINLIRQINGIRVVTNQQFFQLYTDIQQLVNDKTHEIEKMIEQKIKDFDFYQFKKLKGALRCIKDLNGIGGSSQDFIDSTKASIQDTIDEHMDQLQLELNKIEVTTEHPENIADLAQIYLNVQEIYTIAKILDINLDKKDIGKSKIMEINEYLQVSSSFAMKLKGKCMSLRDYKLANQYMSYLEVFKFNTNLKTIFKDLKTDDIYDLYMEQSSGLFISQNKIIDEQLEINLKIIQDSLSVKSFLENQEESKQQIQNGLKLNTITDEAIEQVCIYIKLLNGVEIKYPQLFQIINDDEDESFNNLKEKLKKKLWLIGNTDDINKIDKSTAITRFKLYKAMGLIDKLINLNIFIPAFKAYDDLINHDPSQEIQKAINMFQSKMYAELNLFIEENLDIGKKLLEHKLIADKIIEYVRKQSYELESKIKMIIFMNTNKEDNLSLNDVVDLSQYTAILIKMQKHLKIYVGFQDIDQQIKTVFTFLQQDFQKQFNKSENDMNARRFNEANKYHILVEEMIKAVKLTLLPDCVSNTEVTDSLEAYSKMLAQYKSLLLKKISELVETYLISQITDFYKLKPKAVIQNLQKIKNREIEEFVENMITNFISQYEELLNQLYIFQKPKGRDKRNNLINDITDSLQYMCKEVKEFIESKTKSAITKHNQIIDEKTYIIKQIIENSDGTIQQLIDYLFNNKIEDTFHIKLIQDDINKRFVSNCNQIFEFIRKYDSKNAILKFEEVNNTFMKVQKQYKQLIINEPGEQTQSKRIKVNDQIQGKAASLQKEIKLSSYFKQEQQNIFIQVQFDIHYIFEKSLKQCLRYFTEDQVKYKVNLSQDSFNLGTTTIIKIQNNESKQLKNNEKEQLCSNIIQCIIEFHQQSSKLIDQIPDSDKQIDDLIHQSFIYLTSLQKKLDQAISKKDITLAVYVISNLNKTEKIRIHYIKMLQQLKIAKPENKDKVIQLDKIFNYRIVNELLLNWVMNIGADIQKDTFINQDTKIFNQKERSDFYNKIHNNLFALRQFQEAQNHFDDNYKKVDKIIIESNNFVNSQIEQIEKMLAEKIDLIGINMKIKDQSHLKDSYINFKTINDIFSKNDGQLCLKKKLAIFEQNILSKIENIISQANKECKQEHVNTQKVSLILIGLKSLEITQFIDIIDKGISQILEEFTVQTSDNSQAIGDLALSLRRNAIGSVIVEKHPTFEGFNICDANKRFQSMTVEDLLTKLRGDNLNKDDLHQYYRKFQKRYEEILTQALTPNYDITNKRLPPSFDFIIQQIKANYSDISAQKWTSNESAKLPELIAYILGLWTIINSSAYQKQSQINNDGTSTRQYLKQPHVGQIITIFRILGLGTSSNNVMVSLMKQGVDKIFGKGQNRHIHDNLVQLKTGEGKSIILAVISIVLALHGFEVRSVCYSQILSDRDYNAFKNLFDLLGISKSIKYGTFKTICEEQINKEGSIREIVVSHFLQNAPVAQINRTKANKPTVLMIDEVDVFFSTDFYGKMYVPQAVIEDPSVKILLDLVWSLRKQKINAMYKDVLKSKEYNDCVKIFKPNYAFIIEEAIKDMVDCVSTIDSHKYEVQDGKIGYVDIDEISFNQSKGYSTTFAYYKENEKKNISPERLNEQKVIGVNCGWFAYAEIPKLFSIILGVTGTLEYLSDSEKYIIQHVYEIKQNTYIPSVFGDQNLEENNIVIEDETQFNSKIVNDCNHQLKDNFSRAVIIFFENQEKLNKFFASKEFKTLKKRCQKLTETVTAQEKELLIQKATNSGQVTLSTATFGRGTDFVSRDPKVNESGGIHIIQTFYSKTLSEEIQIKGRTSRQGDQGSYSLILHSEQLQDFCIQLSDIQKTKNTTDKGKMLSKFRQIRQHKENNNNTLNLTEDQIQHDRSNQNLNLVKSIIEGKEQENQQLYEFFKQLNIGRVIESATKTLVLIDATGSMGNMLQKTKAAVVIMFERAKEILIENKMNPNLFMMQIACYRNYSSGIDKILQSSSWESNATNLQQYMKKIDNLGGQGNEALEIGLQHANQEILTNVENPISQIFIIGDAIPNTQAEVTSRRKGTKWENSNYAIPTHYEAEMIKIQNAGVPVFTFYVANDEILKNSFGRIACNGGTCQYLDIDDEKRGQKDLIDFFTKQILQRIGDLNNGNGSLLVSCYNAKLPSYR